MANGTFWCDTCGLGMGNVELTDDSKYRDCPLCKEPRRAVPFKPYDLSKIPMRISRESYISWQPSQQS